MIDIVQVLFSNTPTHYLKVKVRSRIMLKFQSFIQQYPAHAFGLKVKVIYFNVLYKRFLRAHIFQTIWCILFIFDKMIDTGPKF